MSNKATILMKLYKSGKVSLKGLEKALEDTIITEEEYNTIIAS